TRAERIRYHATHGRGEGARGNLAHHPALSKRTKCATTIFFGNNQAQKTMLLNILPDMIRQRFLLVNFPFIQHRSEEHTSELQSRENLVCRLLLEKKNI